MLPIAAAQATNTAQTPAARYRALLTMPFKPAAVAGRFSSGAASRVAPSATARRHHAIGAVQIAFANGGGSILYTVFRTHADAIATWNTDMTNATRIGNFRARLRIVGIPTKTAFMFLGLGSCDPSPCTSTATFVWGVAKIDVSVAVAPNGPNYDQPATTALARAAYAHLLRVS